MRITLLLMCAALLTPATGVGWNNGPRGNARTDQVSECDSAPYSTHDWIADKAVMVLPDEEKAWLLPHKTLYLLGTEAPDNNKIPEECGTPHTGYDDRGLGHSVEWQSGWSDMSNDRAARRAQEEYEKALIAAEQGDLGGAAFYLGAMSHYLADLVQYGHVVSHEMNHGNYESWVNSRTLRHSTEFDDYLNPGILSSIAPYAAAKRISLAIAQGSGSLAAPADMDALWETKPQRWRNSVGASLALGVAEIANVLHSFWATEVAKITPRTDTSTESTPTPMDIRKQVESEEASEEPAILITNAFKDNACCSATVPPSIETGKEAWTTVSVSVPQAVANVVKEIEKRGIEVSFSRIGVMFDGEEFIDQIGNEIVSLSPGETREWRAKLRPTLENKGDAEIFVSVTLRLRLDAGPELPREVYARVLTTTVVGPGVLREFASSTGDFLLKNWGWTWAIIVVPAGTLLWRRIRKRRNVLKKDADDGFADTNQRA